MESLDTSSRLYALERRVYDIESLLGMAQEDQAAPPRPVQEARPQNLPAAPMPPRPEISTPELEQTIGLKWTGRLGAIVLVIGAALGVQFAYENNWFGHIPPALRLAAIFVVGALLIGAGEYVLRRIHPISAAGLFGAGVATLFVGAYAGYAYWSLYSRSASMSLMVLSTLVGAAVAMRGNLVSIAVLSLVGANIAPLLVATPDAPLVPFLFYLLMMQCVALFLAAWGRGGKWWTLRGISLVPIVIWTAALLLGSHAGETAILAFMLIFAAIYHAELIVTTIRRDAGRAAPVAFALTVTAALTAGVLTYYSTARRGLRADWAIGLATISAVLGVVLPRMHPSLRRLAQAHRTAAAALAVMAIPIATSGLRVEIGWAALAVAFAVAWSLTGSPVSRVAAPITWGLGVWYLMLIAFGDLPVSGHGDVWLTIWGTSIGATVVIAWIFAAAGHAIAQLIVRGEQTGDRWLIAARALIVGSGLVGTTGAAFGLPCLGGTTWMIAYVWLLVAADRLNANLKLAAQAGVTLVIAIVKWMLVDAMDAKSSPAWAVTTPVFNSMTCVGVLSLASLLLLYRLGRPAVRGAGTIVALAAVIQLGWIGSLEIDRAFCSASLRNWLGDAGLAENAALSVYWSSIAIVALAAGFWRRVAPLRYLGLGLLAVTLVKIVVVDLSQAGYGYRVLSFIALGLVLLGTSVMYGKISPKLLGTTR